MQSIAIQSYCYRHFKPLDQFIGQLQATGVDATELCGVHANFADPATFSQTIDQLKQSKVKVVAIGVETMTGDPTKDRPRFEFCRAAGVRNMSISFAPELMFDGLRNVEKLADEFDLQLGIHNHGGYDWLGNSVILKYVLGKTSKRIGLHLDTAWAIDAKQNPVEMVEKFGDRLFGVHVKDFIYSRNRIPEDVIIGEGNLDLTKFMAALNTINFNGPLVIEYEGDVENPVPTLKRCVDLLRKLS